MGMAFHRRRVSKELKPVTLTFGRSLMAKLPGAKYMPCGQRVVLFGGIEQVLCPAEPGAGYYNLSEVSLPCVFCSRNKSQAEAPVAAAVEPVKAPVEPEKRKKK